MGLNNNMNVNRKFKILIYNIKLKQDTNVDNLYLIIIHWLYCKIHVVLIMQLYHRII